MKRFRATRVEDLADRLGQELSRAPGDPFAEDLVVTRSGGVQRWLAQHLSHRLGSGGLGDGLCARVSQMTLAQYAHRARGGPARWASRSLVPVLLDQLASLPADPVLTVLQNHLGDQGSRPWRRARVAEQVAARFANYAVWRQPMLRRWWDGDDVGADGTALASEQLWQVWLWRLSVNALGMTPWEEADQTSQACADKAASFARIALFCPETWSPQDQQILAAIADVHPVMIFDQPTPNDQTAEVIKRATWTFNTVPRLISAALDQCVAMDGENRSSVTATADSAEVSNSLLQRLQRCFSEGMIAPPADDESLDDSVQFYAAPKDQHADVLANVVVDTLNADPTLEPGEILVVLHQGDDCRDQFDAVLFSDEDPTADDSHHLRAVIAGADDLAEQTLDMLSLVMSIVQGRASAEDLLRLCSVPLLRDHFDISDDQFLRLRTLVQAAGIRWGINADDRGMGDMADFAQNTWMAGLGRMTLGVALREDDLVWRGTVLPLDATDSDTVRLVGCLGQIMAQIRSCCHLWPHPTSPTTWGRRLRDCAEALVGTVSPLAAAVIASFAANPTSELTLAETERLLDSTRRGFVHHVSYLNGDLGVTPSGTMDLVPFKVIIVAGLEAGHFPRTPSPDGDDIGDLSSLPQLDSRMKDYQGLRDAVMSARRRLIVIFDGFDSTTGKPGLTPVSELMALCEASSQSQPNRLRCDVSSGPSDQAWQHAGVGSDQLKIITATPVTRSSVTAANEVTLDDFCALFTNPATHWLKRNAGLPGSAFKSIEPIPEVMPPELTPLTRWIVTDTMMRLLQAGHNPDAIVEAELRRGSLPPGSAGWALANDCLAHATAIVRQAQPWLAPLPRWISIDLPGSGDVPDLTGQVRVNDATVCHVSAGRIKSSAQLSAWITVLGLTLVEPDISWQAVLIGNRAKVTLHAPSVPEAARHLSYLRQLHRRGLDSPLPLPPVLAAHIARCLKLDRPPSPADVTRLLHRDWDHDPAWKLLWSTPARLLAEPVQSGDAVSALDGGAGSTRLTALARGAYLPVLQAGGVA